MLVCVQVQMQAALSQALQGVTPEHLEAATGAGPAADLCQLPSAAHLAAGEKEQSGPTQSSVANLSIF